MHESAIFMADAAAASQCGKTIKDGLQGITLPLSVQTAMVETKTLSLDIT